MPNHHDKVLVRLERIFTDATGHRFSPSFRKNIRSQFLPYLRASQLITAMNTAIDRIDNDDVDGVVRYFCGCCWHKRRESEGAYVERERA